MIWIVQHCQSEHHVNDLTGGWTDTPLTELGRAQPDATAQRLATELAEQPPTVYSSDLLRASQTAEPIGHALDVDVLLDGDLREGNNGAAAGKTEDWAREHVAPPPAVGIGLDRRPFEGAETPREFFHRVSTCVERLWGSSRDRLVLVTHGGVVIAAVAWWLGLSPEQYATSACIARPASITVLRTDDWGRRVLAKLGDLSHIEGS